MSDVAAADQSTILKQTSKNLNISSTNFKSSGSSSDSIPSGNCSLGSTATDYAVHGTQHQQPHEQQFKEDKVEDQNYLDPQQQQQLKLATLSEIASASQTTARDFILKESRFQTTNEQQGNCMILNELSTGQKSIIVEENSAHQTACNRQQQQSRQNHCQCTGQQQQNPTALLPLQQSCSKNLHHLRTPLAASGAAVGNQQLQREASQLNAPASAKYQQPSPSKCSKEGTNFGISSNNSTGSLSSAPASSESSSTVLGKGIKRPALRANSSEPRQQVVAVPSAPACGAGGSSNQQQASASSQTSQALVAASEDTSGASNPQGGSAGPSEKPQVVTECSSRQQQLLQNQNAKFEHQQQQEEDDEEGEEEEDSEDDLNFDYEPVLTKILNEKKLALSNSPDVIKFLSNLQQQQKVDQLHNQNQQHQLMQPQLQLQHHPQHHPQTEQVFYHHLHHNNLHSNHLHHHNHLHQQPNHCIQQQSQQNHHQQHMNTPIGFND